MSAEPLPLYETGEKFARCCVEHKHVLSVTTRRVKDGDEELLVCPQGHVLKRFEAWAITDLERNAIIAIADINGAILISGELLEPARPTERGGPCLVVPSPDE